MSNVAITRKHRFGFLIAAIIAQPTSAFRRVTVRSLAQVFIAGMVLEIALPMAVIVLAPRVVSYRARPAEGQSSRIETGLEASHRLVSASWDYLVVRLRQKAWSTLGPLALSLLLTVLLQRGIRVSSVVGLSAAAVYAGLIDSCGQFLRSGLSFLIGRNIAVFSLSTLLSLDAPIVTWLGGLDVFRLWWCVVFACGVAVAWSVPPRVVLPGVLLLDLGWMIIGELWHRAFHLNA